MKLDDLPEDQREQFQPLIESLGLDDEGKPPELHPDLAECIAETPSGPMIQHSLVHTLYSPISHGVYNHTLEVKLKALKEYEVERKWWPIIFVIHERPYRFEALSAYADLMSDEEFWDLVGDIWTDSENIWQHAIDWRVLFATDRPGREHMMDGNERKALAELPDEFKIYRGTGAPSKLGSGLSWTLDRERAKWFARRLLLPGHNPRLITAKVKRQDVIAYFDGRGEKEIVVLPEHVKIQSIQKIRKEQ